ATYQDTPTIPIRSSMLNIFVSFEWLILRYECDKHFIRIKETFKKNGGTCADNSVR
ncbi:hypothetical protein L9F63_007195, partial [Diploptera punctata]